MQQPTPTTPASPIPVPKIDSDEPVAVIPTASVAPLDGRPDGERINIYTLAPMSTPRTMKDFANDAFGEVQDRVLRKPLTYVALAFSLGFVVARVLR
jgi:hypothetical protein